MYICDRKGDGHYRVWFFGGLIFFAQCKFITRSKCILYNMGHVAYKTNTNHIQYIIIYIIYISVLHICTRAAISCTRLVCIMDDIYERVRVQSFVGRYHGESRLYIFVYKPSWFVIPKNFNFFINIFFIKNVKHFYNFLSL